MKLYKLYFSPTGGTKKVADIVGRAWNNEMEEIDLSDTNINFKDYIFKEEDICLVAVPSFGGRVPAIAVERLKKITGGNAKAIILTVYGNRAYEDTLLELKDTLKNSEFQCVAAIAGIAEHSIMHQFGANRPDSSDEKELEEFGEKVKILLEQNETLSDIKVPGNSPYKEYNGVPFKPQVGGKCTKCGQCVVKCPVKAISKKDPTKMEKSKCISCMRCIAVCPQHARVLNKVVLFAASQKMNKACSIRKSNELFI
ncbi:MAG: 4Fe-4S binding protein [Lachnospiraceae bacterium]